jgi:hypothetical protein
MLRLEREERCWVEAVGAATVSVRRNTPRLSRAVGVPPLPLLLCLDRDLRE